MVGRSVGSSTRVHRHSPQSSVRLHETPEVTTDIRCTHSMAFRVVSESILNHFY